ncbi:PAS domain S-box protein [Aromatoleum toluolicum]|uniref:histidine kinase n=1 Tax=Aromatoleum toluolicum TaxID=90060 RepID=A0ABX1NKS5_9RHOO|nr:PAS domain S-box protein [Aromatoleum toluolicum]NMF99926.1 PAS domain S-box protein [Aromatoleum toluolicum]
MQREDELRLILDSAPAMIRSARPDGHVDFVNRRWSDYVGLPPEELLGWGWTIAIHPDDVTRWVEEWRAALANGVPFEAEGRVRRADGEYRRFLHRDYPLRDGGGAIVRWYGSSVDIDGLKRTQAQLQESEERFRRMADAIPEVIWFTALHPEKVLYASPSFEHIWGRPVEDLHRNPRLWIESIHPDDRLRIETTFSRWVAGEDPDYQDIEYRIVQPGGTIRWIHERGVLGFDEGGHPALVSGISTDITERKQADDELRRSAAYLAEAQRLSRTGSFGWNVASGELVWSKETFCILGYDAATTPTLNLVFDRVHPDDRSALRDTLDRAARELIDFDLMHRLLMPDGTIKQVHVVARAVGTGPGAAEFVGAIMDITEQKNSEDETRAAKARFEGILAIAEDAIISVDSHERIVLFNQGAEAVFGYSASELIGQSLNSLIPQRLAAKHSKHLAEFTRSRDIARAMGQRTSVVGRRKDGREFPAEASISKLDIGGKLIFTVILRDVTERQQAAEALRASEHLARGQLDALTHMLDALARESDPDRLLEHVLRTIIQQSGAHSVCVWDWNEDGDSLDVRAILAAGDDHLSGDANHPAQRLPGLLKGYPVWSELLRTGLHGLLEDLDTPSPHLCVGCEAEATCSRVFDDADPDPAVSLLKERWRALEVNAILFMPMTMAGKVAGIIGMCCRDKPSFRREDVELTRALAHQAMLAIHLMRLSQQSRQMAVTAERNRMARDIHDTLAQGFTGVIVQLEAAADARAKGLVTESEAHLARAGNLARESLQEARRSVHALRPRRLERNDLCEALRRLMSELTAGTAIVAELTVDGEPRAIPATWEENILRIGQEALTNALRHGHANRIGVRISFSEKALMLRLRDDGRGFDPGRTHDGFGLVGIGERVKEMGGQLSVDSAPAGGTEIAVVLPIANVTTNGV